MGKTLSFGKGKGNIRHNNREYCTPNVDQSRLKDNVYLVQETVAEAYEKCFGRAIEEYNEKQRRADRKKTLDGYMDEIKRNQANRNGEKLFYEQVIGVGDMYDSGILTKPEDAQKCKSILLDYFKEWQSRNPNLYVFNAVLHMDEQTPHLHIDYIPVGHGYKQGLQTRNSLTKAFDNMGIDSSKTKDDNSTIKWQSRERERITEIAKGYGVEIDVLGIKRQDYTIDEYKAIVRDEKQALKQIKAPKVKRTLVPLLNIGIEWNPKAVDKALERKANVKAHAETFKQATASAEAVKEHFNAGLKEVVEQKEQLAEAKLQHDEKSVKVLQDLVADKQLLEKQIAEYEKKYKFQEDLNRQYEQVLNDYMSAALNVSVLQSENRELRQQIKELEENQSQSIEQAVSPIKATCDRLQEENMELSVMTYNLANRMRQVGSIVMGMEQEGFTIKEGNYRNAFPLISDFINSTLAFCHKKAKQLNWDKAERIGPVQENEAGPGKLIEWRGAKATAEMKFPEERTKQRVRGHEPEL